MGLQSVGRLPRELADRGLRIEVEGEAMETLGKGASAQEGRRQGKGREPGNGWHLAPRAGDWAHGAAWNRRSEVRRGPRERAGS